MKNENRTSTAPDLEHVLESRALLAPRRGAVETQLEALKQNLLEPMLKSTENTALARELRWVANEAAALAWFTVCPILVLPALFEEKVREALSRWERQQRLLPERREA